MIRLLLAVDDRSTGKPSSSIVAMSPVLQPAVGVDQAGGGLGTPVVARGHDRAAGQELAVVGDPELDAGVRATHGAELEGARTTRGRAASAGLRHAPDVVDRHPEPGEEAGHLQGHRRRRRRPPDHPVEAEHRRDRAEHRGVHGVVPCLELRRGGVTDLERLDVLRADLHGALDRGLLDGVRLPRQQPRETRLDLLPHPGYAEELLGVHLAQSPEQEGRVGYEVHVAVAVVLRVVEAQDPLGDVGVAWGEVGETLRMVRSRPLIRSPASQSNSTLRWVSSTPLGSPVVPEV